MKNIKRNNLPSKALIYCRVSSERQVNEGSGLESQETRCRGLAKAKGYIVERVFHEEGVSGALFDRPAMKQLLDYLDAHEHESYAVIFDDLKRFARDYDVHKRLKIELVVTRQVKLECLNFNFEDTPESEFIEGILALHGELERKQNRRQVIQKMKARLERGYWPFCPPLALINEKSEEHGKKLIPREPFASIFKGAIEGYASNMLNSHAEVRDYIQVKYRQEDINRPISDHGVGRILKCPLYGGYIEYPKWDVGRRESQHEGLVSKEVFERVESKLAGRSKPKFNKTFSADFPLRRFVTCESCGSKLRASWNKGRSKKYPNYWCQEEGCKYKYKVTKAWDLHDDFEQILSGVKISEGIADLAKAIFIDAWEEEKINDESKYLLMSKEIKLLDGKIEKLVERLSVVNSDKLASVYESEIEKLGEKKIGVEDDLSKPKFSKKQFGSSLNTVYKTLENPLLLWNSNNLEDKRTALFMYFENGLSYDYEKGFGSVSFSPAINLLSDPSQIKFRDVEMAGSEPASVTEQ